jgi:hypothetical protein
MRELARRPAGLLIQRPRLLAAWREASPREAYCRLVVISSGLSNNQCKSLIILMEATSGLEPE